MLIQNIRDDFQNLKILNKEFPLFQKNQQFLMTGGLKSINKLSPLIMSNIFEIRESLYNTRYFHQICFTQTKKTCVTERQFLVDHAFFG